MFHVQSIQTKNLFIPAEGFCKMSVDPLLLEIKPTKSIMHQVELSF